MSNFCDLPIFTVAEFIKFAIISLPICLIMFFILGFRKNSDTKFIVCYIFCLFLGVFTKFLGYYFSCDYLYGLNLNIRY